MKHLMLYFVLAGLVNYPAAWAAINIGYEADNESLTASGSSTHWDTDTLEVGYKGNTNQLSIINGATLSASGGCSIGRSSWSSYYGDGIPANKNTIEVSGTGSRLDISGWTRVGYGPGSENNRLLISNGGLVNSFGGSWIGVYSDDDMGNKVEVAGIGSTWNVTSELTVGYRSSGNSMIISDGATVATARARVGYRDAIYMSDNNHVVVTGSGSTWDSGHLAVTADSGSNNRVEILDGAVVTSTTAAIDPYNGGENNGVIVSGQNSKWLVDRISLTGSYSASGKNYLIIESGGEVVVNNEITLDEYYTHRYLDLNAGGKLTVGADFDASIDGLNYNAGSTLAVEGQLTGLPVLEADRRLEAAVLLGDMSVHGTFAPGNSPADSVMNGILTIASDGTLEMELGGYVPGDEHDRLTVSDTANLFGTLDIVLLDDFSVAYGDTFDLFNWDGGVNGEFDRISTSALTGDLEWDTSDLYSSGSISVIPEPNTVALFGVFGAGLWIFRRHSRRSIQREKPPRHDPLQRQRAWHRGQFFGF